VPHPAEVTAAYRSELGPEERAALWSWLGFTTTFAVTYGTGLALIVDEFALLLDLEDVYWAKQGRVSVDLGVGIAAAGGTTLSAVPILRRPARNRHH
jgi:hypothetical protein